MKVTVETKPRHGKRGAKDGVLPPAPSFPSVLALLDWIRERERERGRQMVKLAYDRMKSC